ncbi:MAG: hypothetical protein M0R06_15510 [Sphaerochaeta sp.]|jgi:hypothetical protein|nr:hypothetical protein [Sphaerochaeta sp.]
MRNNTLRLNKLVYQRNGGSGTGFFVADITLKDPGTPMIHLFAVLSTGHGDDPDGIDPVECYVIDPTDLDNHWRGDNIGRALVPLVREHVDACWPAQYPEAAKRLPVTTTLR